MKRHFFVPIFLIIMLAATALTPTIFSQVPEPAPAPAPAPEPQPPPEPVVQDPVISSIELFLDSRAAHGARGAADLTEAQADEADMLQAYQASQQHTLDVQVMLDESLDTVVAHGRAAIGAINAMLEELVNRE